MREQNTTKINEALAEIAERDGLEEALSSSIICCAGMAGLACGLTHAQAFQLGKDLAEVVTSHSVASRGIREAAQ